MSHRTQVTLTDEQYAFLRDESRRSGVALAELVRRALERSYGPANQDELLRALDASFGSWSGRDGDGEAYVEDLRQGLARRLALS